MMRARRARPMEIDVEHAPRPGRLRRDRRQLRGAALLLVLWAIVILSLVAGGICFAIRQDVAVSGLERDRVVAHWMARAGVERAIGEIMQATSNVVTNEDDATDNPTSFQEVALTGGSFSVIRASHDEPGVLYFGAADEAMRLNLNSATREQLMQLPDMTAAIAGAILDWRDRDEQPEPDGIESGHYASLLHPYVIRNGPFQTVRELLLVRGVTPERFFGEDANLNGELDANEDDGSQADPPDNADGRLEHGWAAYLTVYTYERNVGAQGEKRLNINKADAQSIARRMRLEDWAAQSIVKARERGEFKSLADLLDVRRDASVAAEAGEQDVNARGDSEKDHAVTKSILRYTIDELTLQDGDTLPGRVNLNTAPFEVLRTLPGADDEFARTIVNLRHSSGGMSSIGELLALADMSKEKFAKLESTVTVRSDVYRIRSHGYSDSGIAETVIECVVDRGGESKVPRTLYWLESRP